MLHKMWPMKKENELTLRWAEMRMIPWMCGVKATDSNELTTQLNTKNGCRRNAFLYLYLKCKLHTTLINSDVILERSGSD